MFTFAFTLEKFKAAFSKLSKEKAPEWFASLSNELPIVFINSPVRVAMFLAQTGHESAEYSVLTENLNYSAKGLMATWPKRFDAAKAEKCQRKPELIANTVYASRMGNGDEASGEGWKYRGRGILQLTGKENYTKFSKDTFNDLRVVDNPDYLLTCEGAVKSACWFWKRNLLNDLSDKGDIINVTKRINGGTIGLPDREEKFKHILAVLKGN